MMNNVKKLLSVILSVCLLAGAAATLTGCFTPKMTPQERYIDARNGFTAALSRTPLRLFPGMEGVDAVSCDITVDKGDGNSPLLANIYEARNGDDTREIFTVEYAGQKFSRCDELLGGEQYQSYPGSSDDYLIFDGDMKDYAEAIKELFDYDSEGVLRVTNRFATPERITTADEQIEVDGRTVSAERFTLTLDRDALLEIRDAMIPEYLLSSAAEAGPDEVIDLDDFDALKVKEDAQLAVSFWQVRGATRKAEIAATENDGNYAITISADLRSDAESVDLDVLIRIEEDGKLTFSLPLSYFYSEKDGEFSADLTVDFENAVTAEEDGSGYGGLLSSAKPTKLTLGASGTYGEGFIKGKAALNVEVAGGELNQSIGFDFNSEKDRDGNVSLEASAANGFDVDWHATGWMTPAEYKAGEYDPERAIRYSEINGEDKDRYEEFIVSSDSLTMLLYTFATGSDYVEPDPGYSLAFSDGVGESYTFSPYDPGDGSRSRLLPLTFADGVASFEVDGEAVSIDYENEQEKVTIGGEEFHCSYEKHDSFTMIFVILSHGAYQYLGGDSYVLTVEFDDPETSSATWYRMFFYETNGDEYVCHLPEGDVTFTYREGDETVVIDGKEFEVRDY